TAAITGLRLATGAPHLFKALVEATAFGSRAIVERFRNEQVPVNGVIGVGGIAKKSPYVMQTLADVLDMPIKVARSEHACALGAAMCAATASGIYPDIQAAQLAMSGGFDAEYLPEKARAAVYGKLYRRYRALGS
ncbi:MAG TPA: FGGY-family carbohydrate kinase, partial [Anseongella sp.]|nr:FGGY-family carbohydrate kinase [Anseongella sp.]